MRSQTGYIGSFLVHLAVIGVAVLCAKMVPERIEDLEAHDPLLLEVWTGDGSERAPGIPGREKGIAQGVATGDKSKTSLGGPMRVNTLNAKSLLKTFRDNQAQAEKEAAEAKSKAESKAKSDSKSTKTSAKTETLDNFKKTAGKATPSSGKSATSGKAAGKTGGSASGISGSSVGSGSGTGKGSGADGFGRASGKGQNGGEGGSGNRLQLWIGDVRGKFADVFIPMFEEQGGDLEASRDRGEVLIRVSPSGLASFAGWEVRPTDPLVERLVLEAILKMRPVPPPLPGEADTVIIPISGKVN